MYLSREPLHVDPSYNIYEQVSGKNKWFSYLDMLAYLIGSHCIAVLRLLVLEF